jgi:septum formation protein
LILKRKIVLASTSAYRAALLRRLGLEFAALPPLTDETPLAGESPRATAHRLSLAKAESLVSTAADALIIGSDQVADLNGRPIGKPGTRDGAHRQLCSMRGQTLVFHSGLCLIDTASGQRQCEVVPTTVRFRPLSDAEIERYLDREPAFDCAGSAKSEGLGVALMESMQSEDPTALVGLPLIALCRMLRAAGCDVLA